MARKKKRKGAKRRKTRKTRKTKRTKKRARKSKRKGHIPLKILERRLRKLKATVSRRGGKV